MKVLIIEDEPPAAKRLKSILSEIDESIETLDVKDSIENSVSWIKTNPLPDLIFMDIQLSDGLSFEIFKQVEIKCPVIFTTAFDEYAIKAFKVNSIDYLLKPIETKELQKSIQKFHNLHSQFAPKLEHEAIQKLLESITPNKSIYKSRFLVKSGQSFFKVGADECAYFYLDNKLTYLVLRNGKRHLVDFTLDELEQQLDPQKFFRANRQFITNIDSITSIHNYFGGKLKIHLQPGEPEDVIISRAKAGEFKSWMES